MPEIEIICPNCEQHIACDESYRGTQINCPTCQIEIRIPTIQSQTAVSIASPPPIQLIDQRPTPLQNQNAKTATESLTATVLRILGLICLAFGFVDFMGMLFHYDITGVSWSPIVAGIIGSVFFSIANAKYKASALQKKSSSEKSKVKLVWLIAQISVCVVIVASIIYLASSNRLTPEQLQMEVRKSIEQKFSESADTRSIQIKGFTLVHENGSKYNGLLTAQTGNTTKTIAVDVTYDGENMMWKTQPSSNPDTSEPVAQPRPSVSEQTPPSQTRPEEQPRMEIQPAIFDPNHPVWNMRDLSTDDNGNLLTALGVLHANPDTTKHFISPQPELIKKAPWNYYGKALKITGMVAIADDSPPESEIAKALGGESSQIVLECSDGTIVEMYCMKSSAGIKVGNTVSLYGLPVGVDQVPNRLGGSDPHLMLVGNKFDIWR